MTRLEREAKTVQRMIAIYCRGHHGGEALCADCQELAAYARHRIERCPFGEEKPTCVHCTIHCYAVAMRERIRAVMRYAGPRMVFHHPVLAVLHLRDGRRKAPLRLLVRE